LGKRFYLVTAMPAKKSRKKTKAKENTTLVPHTAPNLASLLERANSGLRSDVQQYLDAGGSPNVLVEATGSRLPLLCNIANMEHCTAAGSINLLLQAGADTAAVSDIAPQLHTALMIACTQPCCSALQALLDGGADPCYQTRDCGATALHIAAVNDVLQHCEILVAASAGRALELAMHDGSTPLLSACYAHESAAVKLLCSLGADVNSSNHRGDTALTAVARCGDVALLQFLLQQTGINVNYSSSEGRTALQQAALSGVSAAVTLLIEYGADVLAVNCRNQGALFAAVGRGHLHIVQLLMQHGCDIHATDNRGCTLLMHIVNTAGADQLAEFLLQQGLSVHALSANHFTALHHAARNRTPDIAQLLLAHSSDVNAVTVNGESSLHFAAVGGHLQTAEVLLTAGAAVSLSTSVGSTPLHYAVGGQHPAFVQLLLEHGAAAVIDSMQAQWCSCCGLVSALMCCKDAGILKLLLTAGADMQAVTNRGNTCLHVAAQHGYTAPVVCLLIKAGADLHAVNSVGKTAAQVAHYAGHTLIEQLLNRAAQG
jgi:ankyrin repeat protein